MRWPFSPTRDMRPLVYLFPRGRSPSLPIDSPKTKRCAFRISRKAKPALGQRDSVGQPSMIYLVRTSVGDSRPQSTIVATWRNIDNTVSWPCGKCLLIYPSTTFSFMRGEQMAGSIHPTSQKPCGTFHLAYRIMTRLSMYKNCLRGGEKRIHVRLFGTHFRILFPTF